MKKRRLNNTGVWWPHALPPHVLQARPVCITPEDVPIDWRVDVQNLPTSTSAAASPMKADVTIFDVEELRTQVCKLFPELTLDANHDAAKKQVHALTRERFAQTQALARTGQGLTHEAIQGFLRELAANINYVNAGKYRVTFPCYKIQHVPGALDFLFSVDLVQLA